MHLVINLEMNTDRQLGASWHLLTTQLWQGAAPRNEVLVGTVQGAEWRHAHHRDTHVQTMPLDGSHMLPPLPPPSVCSRADAIVSGSMVLLTEAQDEKADSISVSDGGFELSVLYDFVSMIGPKLMLLHSAVMFALGWDCDDHCT